MKVLSLCDGVGTGLLALKNIGIPVEEYHSFEILPEAIAVTEYHHPEVIQHGDLYKANWEDFKGFDLVMGGMCCFGEDELVLTSNGYKKISDINVGDYVLTHKNRYKKVTNKFNNGVKTTIELYTMQSSKIECTSDHKFYVRRLNRKYNQLTKCDERVFSTPEWIEAGFLNKNYYVGTPINQIEELPIYEGTDVKQNKYKTVHKNELQEKFSNKEFWKMVGRFIGDGWVSEYTWKRKTNSLRNIKRVIICCSHNEKKELEQIIDGAGFKYCIQKRRTTYEFVISNYELASYLLNFGKGAEYKHLTKDVLNLPSDLLRSFLDGYISADGCYLKNKKLIQFTTISKQLAYDVSNCWNKVYKIHTSVTFSKRPNKYIIENRMVNQKNNYIVRCPLYHNKQDKAFYENGYIWSPFRRVVNSNKSQNVYDIEVEGDHSYIVNNIIVHNCQTLSRVRIENPDINNGLLGKSGIIYELQKALDIIKPKWFFAENVIPSRQEDKEEIDRIMGCEAKLIDSGWFTAQNRERLYWTNIPIAPIMPKDLVIKDIMQYDVDEKYFYDKDFEVIGENKRVCALLNVNTMEMNKRIYNVNYQAPTLTCINGGYHEKSIMDNGRPRKLTEIEYERLQGFPDNYTNVLVNGRKLSYSKRCSMMGNSWTVPVVEHIFKGINGGN